MTDEIVTPHRLEALTDGIFAFSMTLLVIFIETPQQQHLSGGTELWGYLIDQYPQFVSYIATFLLLANFWIIHHQISHYIKRINYVYLWMNIFFMLSIVLLPFSSDMLGDFPELWGSVFIFMMNLFVIVNMLLGIWLYASHKKRLLDESVTQGRIRMVSRQLWLFSLISVLSIIISFWHLQIAVALYIFLPVFSALFHRYYREKNG